VHPADDYVESHIVGNDAANNFFSLGQWVGSAYVQFGSAVGLWAVGRYIVPTEGESKTNKYSEVGFDLLRAQILSGVLVQGDEGFIPTRAAKRCVLRLSFRALRSRLRRGRGARAASRLSLVVAGAGRRDVRRNLKAGGRSPLPE
jgi:hypothetical protein